jgi:hypothetical protein
VTEDRASRAVRAIRYYLPNLVGDDRAAKLDAKLVVRLREARDPSAAVELLSADPATQTWLADFFETGMPPEIIQHLERGGDFADLPGHAAPIGADRYVCPVDGLYEWYRVEVSEKVPDCPDHPGTALVRPR